MRQLRKKINEFIDKNLVKIILELKNIKHLED